MTLNLRNNLNIKTTQTQSNVNFLNKHKITINQVVQTHFSVQGVQAYSPQQIVALKIRQQKKNNTLEGQFIGLQVYKIDDEIEFTEKPVVNNQNKIKAKKSQKTRLQSAKQIGKQNPNQSRKIIKPSIRNEVGRANRNLNKIDKNLQKKQDYQDQLAQLTKKYKQHFGQQLTTNNNNNNKKKKKVQQKSIKQEEQNQVSINDDNQENNQVGLEQEEGDQYVPTVNNNKKAEKSIKTMAKTGKNNQEQQDADFQQVQWQQQQQIKSKKSNISVSSSRFKASTYSQKLGNAVHFLFD